MIRMNAAQQDGVAHRILPRAGRAVAACFLFAAMTCGVLSPHGSAAWAASEVGQNGGSVLVGAFRQASPALFKMLDERSSFLEETAAAHPSAEELRA